MDKSVMLPANKLAIGLFINCALFSGTVFGEVLKANNNTSDAFSARQYCLSTKGTLNETAHAEQFTCCYKDKCLLIDTEKGKSVILEKK
jgi:hypothetical protein